MVSVWVWSHIDSTPFSARDLSEKTTIYSALVGILNARKFELGEEVGVVNILVAMPLII